MGQDRSFQRINGTVRLHPGYRRRKSLLVQSAYSSGTPAIGVGVGNTVSIIDGTTDMAKVAEMIVRSKAYDSATSCSTENNIIVFESCYDEFVDEMAKHGAGTVQGRLRRKSKIAENHVAEHSSNDHACSIERLLHRVAEQIRKTG